MKSRVVMTLWLVLILTAPLNAQPMVKLPDGKAATPASVFRLLNQRSPAQTDRDRNGYVVHEGIEPFSAPSARSGKSGSPSLRFMDRVTVWIDGEQTDANYALIGRGSLENADRCEIYGWVPTSAILTRTGCLREIATNVAIKAIPINSLNFLKAMKGNSYGPPQIRLAPDLRAPSQGAFRLFGAYFVYADTEPKEPEKGFFLLGERQSVYVNDPSPNVKDVAKMAGWVEKSRVCRWDTREGFQWNDRDPNDPSLAPAPQEMIQPRKPGRGYDTEEDLIAYINGNAVEATMLEQFVNARPQKWENDRMRYPLLKIDDRSPKTEKKFGPHTIRRIGLIGDVYGDEGQLTIKESQIRRTQGKIAAARGQLRKTEILFVIDNTTSMKESMQAASEAVRRLITQAQKGGNDLSVAFAYYNDVPSEGNATPEQAREAVLGGPLRNVVTPEFRDDLNKLRAMKEAAGGDRPEQLFAGLDVGLEVAGPWTPSARKLCVLIGDDGNHQLPQEQENLLINRIVDRLAPASETAFEFYALHITPTRGPTDDPTRLFLQQARKILGRLKERAPDASGEVLNAVSSERLIEVVGERFAALRAEANRLDEELRKIQLGQYADPAKTKLNDPKLAKLLESQGVNLEQLKGTQVFDRRWVTECDPKQPDVPQLRKMILVSERELRNISELLRNFFASTSGEFTTKELVEQLLELQKGDAKYDEDEKAFLQENQNKRNERIRRVGATYGLSFIGEFIHYVERENDPDVTKQPTRNERMKIFYELKKKSQLLEDILKGQKYAYTASGPDDHFLTQRGPRPLPGSHDRKFTKDGDAYWYWIDHLEEWP